MKTRTLIRLDFLVGLPLCAVAFLASLPGRAFGRLGRRPAGTGVTEPRRILVIKLLGMGSVVLATPMLRRLRAAHPQAHIAFLTFKSNAELVRRIDAVDEVIEVPFGHVGQLLSALPALMFDLRRRRFDLAIDLEFYSRLSNVLSWLVGARRRVGFFVRARWRGSLLTDAVYFNATVPFGVAVLALLRPLGLVTDDEPQGHAGALLPPKVLDGEAHAAWERLVAAGVPAQVPYIVVNVNASDLCVERRWPAERFAGLVSRFEGEVAQVGRFVFIGAKGEQATVSEVLALLTPEVRERCVDLSGRTSVVDLMVLLSRAALAITNDSGPLHLAAALDVPTVSFFGPETPALYGPVGSLHLVFYAGHWCSPCLSVYNAKIAMCAGENECMRRIVLDDVVTRTAAFCRERVGLAPPRGRQAGGAPLAPGAGRRPTTPTDRIEP